MPGVLLALWIGLLVCGAKAPQLIAMAGHPVSACEVSLLRGSRDPWGAGFYNAGSAFRSRGPDGSWDRSANEQDDVTIRGQPSSWGLWVHAVAVSHFIIAYVGGAALWIRLAKRLLSLPKSLKLRRAVAALIPLVPWVVTLVLIDAADSTRWIQERPWGVLWGYGRSLGGPMVDGFAVPRLRLSALLLWVLIGALLWIRDVRARRESKDEAEGFGRGTDSGQPRERN